MSAPPDRQADGRGDRSELGGMVAIATKHGKEHQFGPALWERFGWTLVVADVDTDRLGTFAGDVARIASPLDTARTKARWGMSATGCRRGLANEGSFGPHPDVPFVSVDVEIAVYLDDHEGLEIVERVVATDTTARSLEVAERELPEEWLESVGFPEHALVLTGPGTTAPVAKGIADRSTLETALAQCLDLYGRAVITSDLRAHVNPTRQRVLRTLAGRLAARIACRCPHCDAPGWGITSVEVGRPCGWCGGPTAELSAEVLTCARLGCRHTFVRPMDEPGDPGWCPRCNP